MGAKLAFHCYKKIFFSLAKMSLDPELTAAWSQVRDDNSDLHWTIARSSDDVKQLLLAGSGTTGLADLLAKLDEYASSNQMCFAGLRIRAVDDRGSVRSIRYKFIRINLIPPTVPMMKKAKAAQLKPLVDTLYAGTHASFDIAASNEINKHDIVRQLQSNAGAHRPNAYEFGGAAEADAVTTDYAGGGASRAATDPAAAGPATAAPPATQSSVPKSTATVAAAPASPTSPPAAASPMRQPPAAVVPQCSSDASPTPVPAGLTPAEAWKMVQSDKEPVNWIMMVYSPPTVWKMGTAGVKEFVANLDPSRVIFGGIRVAAIDDRGSVQSVRAKFVFVGFVGAGVKAIAKAQAGPQKSTFEQILSGTHCTVAISAPEELTEEWLEQRLQASAGAHKPNRYDFTTKLIKLGD